MLPTYLVTFLMYIFNPLKLYIIQHYKYIYNLYYKSNITDPEQIFINAT